MSRNDHAPDDEGPRIRREKRTVAAMVGMYCHGRPGTALVALHPHGQVCNDPPSLPKAHDDIAQVR